MAPAPQAKPSHCEQITHRGEPVVDARVRYVVVPETLGLGSGLGLRLELISNIRRRPRCRSRIGVAVRVKSGIRVS